MLLCRYEYEMTREYNWTVKQTEQMEGYEHSYCFVMRDDSIYYDQLETRCCAVYSECSVAGVLVYWSTGSRHLVKFRWVSFSLVS